MSALTRFLASLTALLAVYAMLAALAIAAGW